FHIACEVNNLWWFDERPLRCAGPCAPRFIAIRQLTCGVSIFPSAQDLGARRLAATDNLQGEEGPASIDFIEPDAFCFQLGWATKPGGNLDESGPLASRVMEGFDLCVDALDRLLRVGLVLGVSKENNV